MPLVRVDIQQNPDPTFARRIGEQIYAALRTCIDVPEHDNFQILTEHDSQHLVYDPQYLGIQRSDGVVLVPSTTSAWTRPACSMTPPSRNRAPPIMPRVIPATSK
mgnify:CR=1 FL=1